MAGLMGMVPSLVRLLETRPQKGHKMYRSVGLTELYVKFEDALSLSLAACGVSLSLCCALPQS